MRAAAADIYTYSKTIADIFISTLFILLFLWRCCLDARRVWDAAATATADVDAHCHTSHTSRRHSTGEITQLPL